MPTRMRALVMVATGLAAGATALADRYPVRETDTIRRTFDVAATPAPLEVEVDNVVGSIEVVAAAGPRVEMVATRTVRARSPEHVAAARGEVTLDARQEGPAVSLYVDGPFRERGDRSDRGRWRDPGYVVQYDFELKVPAATDLYLRTVNDGEIDVEGVAGAFDVENVNGGVALRAMSGSGRAYALNGRLSAAFTTNPTAGCYFGSLNGEIVLQFQPGLAADLSIKTFNGDIFTDFAVTPLAAGDGVAERRGTKFVYRADGSTRVRVGEGGVPIEVDGFNGNIRILRAAAR